MHNTESILRVIGQENVPFTFVCTFQSGKCILVGAVSSEGVKFSNNMPFFRGKRKTELSFLCVFFHSAMPKQSDFTFLVLSVCVCLSLDTRVHV